jgi:hypothetical protein
MLFLVVLAFAPAHARQRKGATPSSADLLRNLPGPLDHHAAALGDRVRVAGKERTVLNGQFTDENGKVTAVRLTLQLPGLLRLEGLTPAGQNKRLEEVLLETFTADTAEGMLASIKDGAAVHLIGRRVGPDPTKRGGEHQGVHDIFEVAGPVRSTGRERLKRYHFDSETGLLAGTHYIDETTSPPSTIEIRFSDWRRVDGSVYAGRIERLENGHPAFSLTVTTIAASPRQDPESLR